MIDNKLVDGDERSLSELIEETYNRMDERDKEYDERMNRLYDEYYTKCKRDTKRFAIKMYAMVALFSVAIILLKMLT